ncbi:MAG: LacI family DNA-binding transcriptional regulator [Verrucomicrobia bacterium]|nr:LacI family DNA-binding transcriptional regulator [Verrucomicrobiota bacterium]
MVRLKDIAYRAGCSVMTVSKALRDAKDISVATKARIQQMAEEMGYVPDAAAAGLRTRSTRLLGLIIPTLTNPLFARVVMAIEEWAYQHGYALLLLHSHNDPAREEQCIRRLLSRRVDGLFISPASRMETTVVIYDELLRSGPPVVILGSRAKFCAGFDCVESDDATASANVTRHLLDLGHRRIAFFAGPQVSPWANDRLAGYKKALREAKVEFDDQLIFQAGATIEEGEKVAVQFLNESTDATAIQAVNDLVAIGVGSLLLKQGLKIPQDYSVAGFGNILVSEHFRVPLTTVRQPKFRLGVAAMELMLAKLRNEKAESKRLPADLVIRQSTATPARK